MNRPAERHAFTVEEANALLPRLRQVLDEIRSLREEASRHHEKLQVLDALWDGEAAKADNPDHEEFVAHRRGRADAAGAVERLVREEIAGRGVRFPTGGLQHGLLDFPTTLDGRWIYLCWRAGEPEVAWWHEVDGGYAGRRPITEQERERMARPEDPARDDDSALDF